MQCTCQCVHLICGHLPPCTLCRIRERVLSKHNFGCFGSYFKVQVPSQPRPCRGRVLFLLNQAKQGREGCAGLKLPLKPRPEEVAGLQFLVNTEFATALVLTLHAFSIPFPYPARVLNRVC